jgi:PucR C-terminal helix-turn-helix domain/GGDEF-like domain
MRSAAVVALDHLAYARRVSVVARESGRTATREVAVALLPELPSIGEGMAVYIETAMPEITDEDVLELIRASCHANCSALLDGLLRGVSLDAMAPSAEVIQTTRALVRYGLSLTAVVRGYQLGTTYFGERWAQAVQHHCTDPSLAVGAVSDGTTFLLGWLERVIDRLAAEYRDEAERLTREGSFARAAEVRRALTDDELDVDAMSRRLAYDLRGRHLALVLKRRGHDDDAPLEANARALASAMTNARPLVVRVDVDTMWCWVPASGPGKLPDPHAEVLVALGRPASGVGGFRRSHQDALEALRVAQLAGRAGGTVTRYDEVELAALCSANVEACRDFVAAELGDLAADTDDVRRLRETLEAFFDSSSNFRSTAARLGLHHNTVRYRLTQAEKLLGHPAGERRLQLELALHIAARLAPRQT